VYVHRTRVQAVYQTGTSELVVRWHGFVDLEEFATAPHASGIQSYTLAVGSSPGAGDVLATKNVGAATHEVIRGLELVSGATYYATVVATDYAGWSTSAASIGVTIDTTPPAPVSISVRAGNSTLLVVNVLRPKYRYLLRLVGSAFPVAVPNRWRARLHLAFGGYARYPRPSSALFACLSRASVAAQRLSILLSLHF
jgi:hypothetical protein